MERSFEWVFGIAVVVIFVLMCVVVFRVFAATTEPITRMEHNGHSYIVLTNNSNVAMCHDPDCQCQNSER